jgi:hypothetical protein
MGMKIRGNTQIIANTIEDGQIATDAAIATSKLADGGNIFMADGTVSATDDLNLGGKKITNLAEPVSDTDAATKVYVDNTAQGLIVKDSARVATTINLTSTYAANVLTSTTNFALVLDGVIVNVGDRILVKNQTAALQNGIYEVTATGDESNPFVLTRTTDADGTPANEVKGGIFTFVQEGTVNADSGWVVVSNDPITVGSTDVNWVQFSGAGQITAGSALTKTGNQLDVAVSSTGGLDISSDALIIKLKALGGLTSDADGLYIDADAAGDGLVWNAVTGAIDVNLSTQAGLTIVNDALQLLIPAGSGMSITEAGLALDASIAGDGLSYVEGVLAVDLDTLSGLEITAGGKLRIDADTAGDGLVWNATTGAIDVNLSTTAGLTIVNDALQLLIPAGAGMSITEAGLALDASIAGDGLSYTDGVLAVDLDTLSGLEITAGGKLRIDADTAGDGLVWNATTGAIDVNLSTTAGLTIVNDALQLLIPAGAGMSITEAGLALDGSIAGDGLSYTDGVLNLDLDTLSGLEITAGGKLRIDADTAGDGLVWNATTGAIDVNLSTTAGLTIVNDALQLLIPAGAGMSITEAGLALDASIAGDGLSYTDGVLAVDLDTNSALKFNSGKLTVDSAIAGTGLTWTDGVISVAGSLGSNLNNGWIYRGNGSNQTATYRDVRNESPATSNYITYTPSYTLVSGTEQVFVNGVLQRSGALNDYNITGGNVVFTSANESSDVVVVSYLATT